MMKGLSYFLPALSLAFTSWLPASVQLSFFVTGVTGFIQAQLFRNEAFRARFNLTPMPKRPTALDAFAEVPAAAEPSPYQPHIITASKTPKDVVYEPPQEAPKTTLLSGLTREVKSGVEAVRTSARQTLKSAKEMAGQDAPDGKKTKNQITQAQEYEKKRRAEESKKRQEMDQERRARREARKMREGR
jgi:YidC/Oxa1 family membrane protein insertase